MCGLTDVGGKNVKLPLTESCSHSITDTPTNSTTGSFLQLRQLSLCTFISTNSWGKLPLSRKTECLQCCTLPPLNTHNTSTARELAENDSKPVWSGPGCCVYKGRQVERGKGRAVITEIQLPKIYFKCWCGPPKKDVRKPELQVSVLFLVWCTSLHSSSVYMSSLYGIYNKEISRPFQQQLWASIKQIFIKGNR